MSAASAAPRAAAHVPGPISVIVSKQYAPGRAQVARGRSGSRSPRRPGCGKMYGTTPSWPGSSGSPAAAQSSQAVARNASSARVVHGLEQCIVVRDRRERSRAPPVRERRGSPRHVREPLRPAFARRPRSRPPARGAGGRPTTRAGSSVPWRRPYAVGSAREQRRYATTVSGSERSRRAPRTRSPTSRACRVGHVTVQRDEPAPPAGRGIAAPA